MLFCFSCLTYERDVFFNEDETTTRFVLFDVDVVVEVVCEF